LGLALVKASTTIAFNTFKIGTFKTREENRMDPFKIYVARANPEVALAVAGASAAAVSPFQIEVRFQGGLTSNQQAAFEQAADRWCQVIVGDLPSAQVDGELIDDVLILAQGEDIDGPGRVLGQAGPTFLRPASAGTAAFLPAKGVMSFDTADLENMEAEGTLNDVITHEMGHVLGIGTIWSRKGLLRRAGTINPTFTGRTAMVEYGRLLDAAPRRVPVANVGGAGTRDSHWRETVFANELMTGTIAEAGNPLSRLTIGSLQDLGYVVDLEAAEDYRLPNLQSLAEMGLLVAHEDHGGRGEMLMPPQFVLPDEALRIS
jgi:hypothetical protein